MAEQYLVLGLGNELFTDEGVGIAAAHRVAQRELRGVDVLDGGTLGIGLLPAVEDRAGVLILDAITSNGAPPGTVVTLDGAAIEQRYRTAISAHQIGLSEVLAAAQLGGRAPQRIAAVGMVPESLDTGYGISATAAAHLEGMVDRAIDIIRDWQAAPDA